MKKKKIWKEAEIRETYVCKNCGEHFQGNFCPECGQSVKELERPFQFLIIDFMGNLFAFDTRFWRTLIAILIRPGSLALDFVKGRRVKYMPPFRFYVFISFIFFLLLNMYSVRMSGSGTDSRNGWLKIESGEEADSTALRSQVYTFENGEPGADQLNRNETELAFLKKHPEIFFQKLWSYFSWVVFLLMPFYGFLLWLFYRKSQKYYITHLIIAINQHSFTYIILIVMLAVALIFPDSNTGFIRYLLLLIPVYVAFGHKVLYQLKWRRTLLRLFAILFVYTVVVMFVMIILLILALVRTGIDFSSGSVSLF